MLFETRHDSHDEARSLDSYFDSLPTKDCTTADCITPVKQVRRPLARKPNESFKPAQVRKYERKVLGYHRRQESSMERHELDQLSSESDKIVSGTMHGYAKLQAQAKQKELTKSSDLTKSQHAGRAPPTAHHSRAYQEAQHQVGFQGYYHNVFADAGSQKPAAAVAASSAARPAREAATAAKAGPGVSGSRTVQALALLNQAQQGMRQEVAQLAALERKSAVLRGVLPAADASHYDAALHTLQHGAPHAPALRAVNKGSQPQMLRATDPVQQQVRLCFRCVCVRVRVCARGARARFVCGGMRARSQSNPCRVW